MEDRASINAAWAEGYAAGKEGASQASNPYMGKSAELAKSWDQGWKEGKENLSR